MTEGDLATLQHAIWRGCLDAGRTITVPASWAAADAAADWIANKAHHADLARFAPTPRPPLMVELHALVGPSPRLYERNWHNPGLLATILREHADRLDARAHGAMLADAKGHVAA